ncbi:FkbM family methyltransferase [Aquisalimonas lutea]|uniref:FkbM family methyltransferase n=1 Tax=Aquisalimonas lutea TaxID=1327750 RepID=UPI0025B36A62|nr:FkbM family methyltransferase [Aquisalimonas lutea]MDN3516214.1 FkbM family methyltransferase [Aquisalimonas lutea]
MSSKETRSGLRGVPGLLRSLLIYWRPGRQQALRRMYRPWIRPGALVLDIGAHLGDRTMAFAGLGARVVALEPQPLIRRWLQRIAGRHPAVTIRPEAVGAASGQAVLAVSLSHPSVSSMSAPWRSAVHAANAGFGRVTWPGTVTVPVVTLDQLIREYGEPAFCKIDVEGYEAQVLAGLSRPLAALSFEFVAGGLDIARSCVARLGQLGAYRFNVIIGEGRRYRWPHWHDGADIDAWLAGGADGAASGDIYALRADGAEAGRD